MPPYLSIAAIYRDEARYLREWINFHRLFGVERFFLYNNRSTDDHLEVLAPYVDDGTVVHEDYPAFPAQLACYERCLETHRDHSRWIVFIDVDEFLFSPLGRPVSEVLRDFEPYAGVVVNCVVFGTSGHVSPPPGPVVENYLYRLPLDRPRTRWVKTIADPRRAVRVGNSPLYFRYEDGAHAVDERYRPVRGHETDAVSIDRLRINHYFTRSQLERERKLDTLRADTGLPRKREGVEERDRRLNAVRDETVLEALSAVRPPSNRRAAGRT
jgi:hypothetical protein